MESFDTLREKLERQYQDAQFDYGHAWTCRELRDAWQRHKSDSPMESRIASRASLISLLFRHAPVAREPDNPFPGKLETFGLLREDLQDGLRLAEEMVPGVQCGNRDFDLGIAWMVDMSHVAPDWRAVLELGLPGLTERARQGTSPFHRAVAEVYGALAEFCHRVAVINQNPVYDSIAQRPPSTLYEAFALAYVVHEAIECSGEEVRTMGRFDQLYIDFYRNDLQAGRLTRDSAKELLKMFWIAFYAKYQGKKYGKNFCFGPDFNELSFLAMEAYYEMNTVDPKLSILVREDMPQDFAELYVKCIRDGRTSIVSLNYEVIVQGLIRHGRTPEDAANFIPIGCYEPAVAGKEISCSGSTVLYLPVQLLTVINSGRDFPRFEDFKGAYFEEIRHACQVMRERQTLCDRAWKYVNPVPLLSGTFASCMEKGRDISDSGAVYNTTGCIIAHFADALDSLAAVRYLVYEHRLCTLLELRDILRANWQGHEELRQVALTRPGKWGNNHAPVDDLGKELAKWCSELLFRMPNGRGGTFFPSLYGQLVVEIGKRIGALPSGRLAGEPMSKNLDAVLGMDHEGVTALMESVLKIDMRQFPCGTCLDLMLHPSSIMGESGVKNLVRVIRTFIRHGGSGIQFNIFDASVLKEAQRHPEKYSSLQVRVCGWNAKFIDLDREAQETFIRQAEKLVF
ncbi:MAG: hypothetical protein IJJ33_08065 [Victivallales bacterium]|nr:hypothetical protein [Victivallales bacterium]